MCAYSISPLQSYFLICRLIFISRCDSFFPLLFLIYFWSCRRYFRNICRDYENFSYASFQFFLHRKPLNEINNFSNTSTRLLVSSCPLSVELFNISRNNFWHTIVKWFQIHTMWAGSWKREIYCRRQRTHIFLFIFFFSFLPSIS